MKHESVKTTFLKYGFGFSPFENKYIIPQLKNGGHLINTTYKQCDCDSVIASLSHPTKRNINTNVDKLIRKGWSETKINNWLENKSKTNFLAKERDQERENWKLLMQELILDQKITKIGLFIHWYEKNIKDEEITFMGRERISVSELNMETLDNLCYDKLYEFVV